MPKTLLLAAALAMAGVMTGPGEGAAPDALAAARGTSRVLLVAAAHPDDPLLTRQRAVYAAMRPGARERDLILIEAVGDGPKAAALRRRFDLDPATFQAVLVGKDGGAKMRSATVLGPQQLFPTIDAMPMRREEMRR